MRISCSEQCCPPHREGGYILINPNRKLLLHLNFIQLGRKTKQKDSYSLQLKRPKCFQLISDTVLRIVQGISHFSIESFALTIPERGSTKASNGWWNQSNVIPSPVHRRRRTHDKCIDFKVRVCNFSFNNRVNFTEFIPIHV